MKDRRLPSIYSGRHTSIGYYTSRLTLEKKFDKLDHLISKSELQTPTKQLESTSKASASIGSKSPISPNSLLSNSADFISTMLSTYKTIIMDKHSPSKSKVTLGNAQKFIHLRRQAVPFKEAITRSAKKITDADREDIDMLLKQVTLMKFSEVHYDYEHITKQYELFENTHNIVNGLIITEGNEAYADELLDSQAFAKIISKCCPSIVKRKRMSSDQLMIHKHGFVPAKIRRKQSIRLGSIEGYAAQSKTSDLAKLTAMQQTDPRSEILHFNESIAGSTMPSRRDSIRSLKPKHKIPPILVNLR